MVFYGQTHFNLPSNHDYLGVSGHRDRAGDFQKRPFTPIKIYKDKFKWIAVYVDMWAPTMSMLIFKMGPNMDLTAPI